MTIQRAHGILKERFDTLDDLIDALSNLSDEERSILGNPHLNDDPTPSELAYLGVGFGQRVMKLAQARRDRERILGMPDREQLVADGIDLLKALGEMEKAGYFARIAMSDPGKVATLDKKRAEIAVEVVDLWEQLKAESIV